jgi:hypothetical protein
MRFLLASFAVICAIACGSSGPSENELKQKVAALRTKIAGYAATLPAVEPFPLPAKVDPPIAFRTGDGGKTDGDNAEVFDFDGLAKGEDSFWEHSNLMRAFASPDLVTKSMLAQAVATRYAIVIRKTEHVAPNVTRDGYTPGTLAVRVYVVDLATDKPLGVFDASAKTPETLEVKTIVGTYQNDASRAETLVTKARLDLWDKLRASLREQLQATLAPLGKVRIYENTDAAP